jgi:hypothetical protein
MRSPHDDIPQVALKLLLGRTNPARSVSHVQKESIMPLIPDQLRPL